MEIGVFLTEGSEVGRGGAAYTIGCIDIHVNAHARGALAENYQCGKRQGRAVVENDSCHWHPIKI